MIAVATPSVAVSLAIESTDNDTRQLTCHVQLEGMKGFTPVVATSWAFTKNGSDGMKYELIQNLAGSQMSAVEVVSCGEQYSSDLHLVQLIVPSGTNEVVCIANVSLPNEEYILSSQGEGGISIQNIIQG